MVLGGECKGQLSPQMNYFTLPRKLKFCDLLFSIAEIHENRTSRYDLALRIQVRFKVQKIHTTLRNYVMPLHDDSVATKAARVGNFLLEVN